MTIPPPTGQELPQLVADLEQILKLRSVHTLDQLVSQASLGWTAGITAESFGL